MKKRDKEPNKKRKLTLRVHGSDWWPARVNKNYRYGMDLEKGRTGYDSIKWDKDVSKS